MPNIGPPNQMAPDPQAPGAANMPLQVNPMAPMSPADVYNFNAANLGDAWKAAQDPQTWTEAAQAYSQAMLAGSIGPEGKGFTAYHGSPHLFDQFDLSKIGTGEGAQAYGHGMYVADSEATAQSYRDALAGKGGVFEWNGQTVPPGKPAFDLVDSLTDQNWRLGKIADQAAKYGPANAIETFDPHTRNASDGPAWQDAMDQFKAGAGKSATGHMYEVNVNADPAKFLDWDAPLSEQHPDVQAALKPFDLDPNTQGPQILTAIHHTQFDDKGPIGQTRRPEDLLLQAGIPGIRYLDRGSRGSGEGTRNSVVFDPATMNIIRRYGLAGLMAGGAAAATQQPSQ